jgi:hypothetical protein
VASIDLRNISTGEVCANIPVLLDTGADVTLLPRGCFSQLQISLDASHSYDLVGFDGSRSTANAFQADLLFLGTTFRGRFLVIDQPDGVLGRDVLNHLNLAFKGPQLLWEVLRLGDKEPPT